MTLSIRDPEDYKERKNRVVPPLADFIRNRQDGVPGRLTFKKSKLPPATIAFLKYRHFYFNKTAEIKKISLRDPVKNGRAAVVNYANKNQESQW